MERFWVHNPKVGSSILPPATINRLRTAGWRLPFSYGAVTAVLYLQSNFQVVSQCRDVPLRWGAELFFVVAAEVSGVLVANTETGAGRVEVFA